MMPIPNKISKKLVWYGFVLETFRKFGLVSYEFGVVSMGWVWFGKEHEVSKKFSFGLVW